jgi:hypothetical protein
LKTREELRRMYSIVSVLQNDCLDIFYKGFAFRMKYFPDKKQSLEKRNAIKIKCVHTSGILGFHMKHNTFGKTVRLCKRWLHAHLLSDKLSGNLFFLFFFFFFFLDEFVELCVVYIFSETVPASPMFGFLRWLRLLGSFNWEVEPLIVSITGTPLKEDYIANGRKVMVKKEMCPFVISDQVNFSSSFFFFFLFFSRIIPLSGPNLVPTKLRGIAWWPWLEWLRKCPIEIRPVCLSIIFPITISWCS